MTLEEFLSVNSGVVLLWTTLSSSKAYGCPTGYEDLDNSYPREWRELNGKFDGDCWIMDADQIPRVLDIFGTSVLHMAAKADPKNYARLVHYYETESF